MKSLESKVDDLEAFVFWDARLIGARNGKRGHSPGQRTSANGRPVYCTERIARTGK